MSIILKHNGQPATVTIFFGNEAALELYNMMFSDIIQNLLLLEDEKSEVTINYLGGITFDISYFQISKKVIAKIDKALVLSLSSYLHLPKFNITLN